MFVTSYQFSFVPIFMTNGLCQIPNLDFEGITLHFSGWQSHLRQCLSIEQCFFSFGTNLCLTKKNVSRHEKKNHGSKKKISQIHENQRKNRSLDRKYPKFSPAAGKKHTFRSNFCLKSAVLDENRARRSRKKIGGKKSLFHEK